VRCSAEAAGPCARCLPASRKTREEPGALRRAKRFIVDGLAKSVLKPMVAADLVRAHRAIAAGEIALEGF
jgi:hypothetical protein